MPDLGSWSAWATQSAWTLVTVSASWGIGHLLGVFLMARAPSWLREDRRRLAQSAMQIIRRRLPRWSLLVGIWISAGYWPLTPEGHLVVERVVFVLGAVSVTLALGAIVAESVEAFGAVLAPALPVSTLTRDMAWAVVAVLGLLVILNGLGVSITPMLTALGIGGLAVALALQEPLANFFAGLFLTLAGQIRVGDYVRLDTGQEGYVVDFSWRSTRLRMLANNLVLVPNAKLAQAILLNYHLPSQDMAVLVEAGVDYSSDLGRVERVVTEVGRDVMATVPGGVPDFEPFVRYHTFGDSSIDFTVILRAREYVDQYLVKHEFIKRLHARFDEEGIVIPFPIRTIARRPEGPSPGAAGGASQDPG